MLLPREISLPSCSGIATEGFGCQIYISRDMHEIDNRRKHCDEYLEDHLDPQPTVTQEGLQPSINKATQ